MITHFLLPGPETLAKDFAGVRDFSRSIKLVSRSLQDTLAWRVRINHESVIHVIAARSALVNWGTSFMTSWRTGRWPLKHSRNEDLSVLSSAIYSSNHESINSADD